MLLFLLIRSINYSQKSWSQSSYSSPSLFHYLIELFGLLISFSWLRIVQILIFPLLIIHMLLADHDAWSTCTVDTWWLIQKLFFKKNDLILLLCRLEDFLCHYFARSPYFLASELTEENKFRVFFLHFLFLICLFIVSQHPRWYFRQCISDTASLPFLFEVQFMLHIL